MGRELWNSGSGIRNSDVRGQELEFREFGSGIQELEFGRPGFVAHGTDGTHVRRMCRTYFAARGDVALHSNVVRDIMIDLIDTSEQWHYVLTHGNAPRPNTRISFCSPI